MMNSANRDIGQFLQQRITELVELHEVSSLESMLAEHSVSDVARAIAMLDPDVRDHLIDELHAGPAAHLLEALPIVQAEQLLEHAEPVHAAAAVDQLPSDLQADLLQGINQASAEAILDAMQPAEVEDVRLIDQFAPTQAGGLMVTELLSFPDSWTIDEVISDLQTGAEKYRDFQIQYAYVCDEQNRLVGVLRLRDLLIGDRRRSLRDVMIDSPLSVPAQMELGELHDFFQENRFLGFPVLNSSGQLLGVVQRVDVDEAWIALQDRSMLRRQGIVSGEEIRSMPLWKRSKGRLMWLSLNIVLNLCAAAIISHFESTLAAAIALTAFLPIISDMSGCSGNQAVAVSIRELMLGLATPRDVGRVWTKEVTVGMINGLAVGVLLGCIAWFWKGNLVLGAVIGVALAVNTIVAVSIGGVVPLVLRGLGRDPAVASGPLLTTITDMCGFFLVLSLATMFLDQID